MILNYEKIIAYTSLNVNEPFLYYGVKLKTKCRKKEIGVHFMVHIRCYNVFSDRKKNLIKQLKKTKGVNIILCGCWY